VSRPPELVLVVDDDEDVVRFVELRLRLEGFSVATASDGEEALRQALELRPDLVLLDVMMPHVDGFEVCARLRRDGRTRNIPIIVLTARTMAADRVLGLTTGADDYIGKPFDPNELVARVAATLRRVREARSLDPLTQLPGNVEMQEEIEKRIREEAGFALLDLDVDGWRIFCERYGFARGEEAMGVLGGCVMEVVARHDPEGGFAARIGGDHFMVVLDATAAEFAARDLIERWDLVAPDLYDADDRERGYIEIVDRRNRMRRRPPMTLSVGIATTAHRRLESHQRAAAVAGDMRRLTKRDSRSSCAIDRRRSEDVAVAGDRGESARLYSGQKKTSSGQGAIPDRR
jgi:DNA-binding response OmpR family regulator